MLDDRTNPGLTPKAVMACLLGMLATGMLIQYSDINVGVRFASEHTLALPAIWVLAALTALSGLVFLLTRWRLLSRPRACIWSMTVCQVRWRNAGSLAER